MHGVDVVDLEFDDGRPGAGGDRRAGVEALDEPFGRDRDRDASPAKLGEIRLGSGGLGLQQRGEEGDEAVDVMGNETNGSELHGNGPFGLTIPL